MNGTAAAQGDEAARTVFVASAGLDIGLPIATGLAARGAAVAWLGDAVEPAPSAADVLRLTTAFDSRATLEAAFAIAQQRIGTPTQVIVSAIPLRALQAADIGTLDDETWRAACGAAMKAVLYTLQAAYTQMAGRGGSVVVLGPSLSLAGAARLVALSTAIEGQRGLVKSTARQWGGRGITVNWIAAAPRALSPLFDTLPLPVKPDPVMVALGRAPDLAADIAPVIDFLASPAGRVMTGATLVLDGGEWMVP